MCMQSVTSIFQFYNLHGNSIIEMASSSSDEELDKPSRPNKRYKLFLDADRDSQVVGHQTRKVWKKKIEQSSQLFLKYPSTGMII